MWFNTHVVQTTCGSTPCRVQPSLQGSVLLAGFNPPVRFNPWAPARFNTGPHVRLSPCGAQTILATARNNYREMFVAPKPLWRPRRTVFEGRSRRSNTLATAQNGALGGAQTTLATAQNRYRGMSVAQTTLMTAQNRFRGATAALKHAGDRTESLSRITWGA